MDTLYKHNVPGLYFDFGGGDSEFRAHVQPYDYYSQGVDCGNCQIEIGDKWIGKLNPIPSTERRVLDQQMNAITTNSRLACCVRVTKDINEAIVVVSENMTDESEFGRT
eukprot:NODE_4790_length_627_cov_53.418685_g4123_i0.p1 GENE.NODE_4790_length_627_cov_53.418685_g4123_i0~~NODE_4790_length_627_cov_53.418685_g4123_i0.p1  ORF type:complete len:109 (+),score=13.64 NODE_4790_length_627_cov_53.418685_g4123_i0:240-566(+)